MHMRSGSLGTHFVIATGAATEEATQSERARATRCCCCCRCRSAFRAHIFHFNVSVSKCCRLRKSEPPFQRAREPARNCACVCVLCSFYVVHVSAARCRLLCSCLVWFSLKHTFGAHRIERRRARVHTADSDDSAFVPYIIHSHLHSGARASCAPVFLHQSQLHRMCNIHTYMLCKSRVYCVSRSKVCKHAKTTTATTT